MIIAHHLILAAYGHWLPNDPRGSWSDFVGSWNLYRYGGPATKVSGARRRTLDPHDRDARLGAKERLKRPPVRFDLRQVAAVGDGFAIALREGGYSCLACAIMDDHGHLVIERHERSIEQISGHIKASASRALIAAGVHPFEDDRDARGNRRSVWAENSWRVHIDCEAHLSKAIEYVEANPVKEGLPAQTWSFVRMSPGGRGSQANRLNGNTSN